MNEILSFRRNKDTREVLIRWWQGLEESRGDRAELRRCHSAIEVAFTPAFHRLRESLERVTDSVNQEALLAIAVVLSHAKENDPSKPLAGQMATPKESGNNPCVSGLRFRRLLKIRSREGLPEPLIRIVKLLNGRVNLTDLADSIYYWGENVRKRWAYDYYAQAPSES